MAIDSSYVRLNSFQYAEMRRACDVNGISWAKAQDFAPGTNERQYLDEWIDEFERKEQKEHEMLQQQLSEAAISAARDAADVSRQAAIASERSARWTMIAALASVAGVVIAEAPTVINWLSKH